MANNPLRSASVHRFRGYVALYLSGPDHKPGRYPATVYLTPSEARAIARAVLACADDCDARTFGESDFRVVEIKPEGNA